MLNQKFQHELTVAVSSPSGNVLPSGLALYSEIILYLYHTWVLGAPNPGANNQMCAGIKSHTYDDSWYRNKCHVINI
jgi:hypothetical protein